MSDQGKDRGENSFLEDAVQAQLKQEEDTRRSEEEEKVAAQAEGRGFRRKARAALRQRKAEKDRANQDGGNAPDEVDNLDQYNRIRRALVFISCISIAIAVLALLYATFQISQANAIKGENSDATREVVVAAADIPLGDVIEASDLTTERVPTRYVPADAVSAEESASLLGKVALVPVSKGIPLSQGFVQGSDVPGSLASSITNENLVALSLALDDASGLSPLLHVGDRVDIVSVSTVNDVAISTVLVSDVRVLALDGSIGATPAEGYSRVSLELTPSEALEVSKASSVRLVLHATSPEAR